MKRKIKNFKTLEYLETVKNDTDSQNHDNQIEKNIFVCRKFLFFIVGLM